MEATEKQMEYLRWLEVLCWKYLKHKHVPKKQGDLTSKQASLSIYRSKMLLEKAGRLKPFKSQS